MPVYVDDMEAPYEPKHRPKFRYTMCHMFADTDKELRSMAQKIGVQQRWHQGDHFDITKTKRRLAVMNGAIEVTLRQAARMMAKKRKGLSMGKPEEAC